MNQDNFFRAEVLMVPPQQYGHVFLNIPLEVRVVTCVGVFLLVCVIFFVIFFEFAETCRIQGALAPDPGMIHIYPQKSGVVRQLYVHIGEHVKKGAPLFLLDTSLEGHESTDAQYRVYMINKNRSALSREIVEKTQQLKSLSMLRSKGYIALEAYQASKDALRVLHEKLRVLKLKLFAETRASSWLLRAPADGVLTQLSLQAGDRLSLNTCAATILPEQSKMVAELYTQMHQLRFLKTHQPVIVHYDAYPNPEGGGAHGTIESLGASVITDQDKKKSTSVSAPYYTAIAQLQQQKIFYAGELRDLKPGMTLWATVQGPRKKIWQWLLGPVYNSMRESVA